MVDAMVDAMVEEPSPVSQIPDLYHTWSARSVDYGTP